MHNADGLVAREHRASPRQVQCGPRCTLNWVLLTRGLSDADECQMPAEQDTRELRRASFEERVQEPESLLQASNRALIGMSGRRSVLREPRL